MGLSTGDDEMQPCQPTLGVMAKHWTPGRVKTRLGRQVGHRQAAMLHRLFLQTLCRRLGTADAVWRNELVFTPAEQIEHARMELSDVAPVDRWVWTPQAPGDLGDRMRAWFLPRLSNHGSAAVLIGADCPLLSPDDIFDAIERLRDRQLVLGPAVDGGYYLIGLRFDARASLPSLFNDVPWSTDRVMAVTRDRARHAGLSVDLLTQREDIDTVEALRRLQDDLRRAGRVDEPHAEQLAERIREVLDARHED